MNKRSLILALLVTIMTIGSLSAQTSHTLYYMNLPQRSSLNPALQPSSRVYVGLPVISDISLKMDNNFLNFSDLFVNGVISDSTFVLLNQGDNLNNFISGLGDKNSIEPQVEMQLLGLAFTVGRDLRITFDITEHADGNLVIPGDLIRLGVNGNDDYMNEDLDFSSLRTEMKYYHEIGIGASKNITEKLRVGGRVMILSGVASGYLKNNGLTVTVNNDGTKTVNADLSLNVSAPVTFLRDEETGEVDNAEFDNERFNSAHDVISYLTSMSNPGLGFEVGAEYRFNDMLAVSAALTDVGFIRWKRDLSQVYVNTSFQLNDLTMQDVYDENVDFGDLMNWAVDSLQTVLDINPSPVAYTTYLPCTFTTGFSFTPVKFFTLGALSQTRFRGKQVHESFTLSGNLNLGNFFSTTLAYTMANRSYNNLGFGIAIRGGYGQFFALIDNIPLKWTTATSGEDTFKVPENLGTIHARLGVNLLFGNRVKD